MSKLKNFYVTEEVKMHDGTHTIFVYGELTEKRKRNEINVSGVKYSIGDGKLYENGLTLYPEDTCKNRTKTFNMGWAICQPVDKFDFNKGVKIAKGRFSKHPIETRDGRFLTNDMIHAILVNEAKYIKEFKLPMDEFAPMDEEHYVEFAPTDEEHYKEMGIQLHEIVATNTIPPYCKGLKGHPDPVGEPGADGYWLSRFRDGDVLVFRTEFDETVYGAYQGEGNGEHKFYWAFYENENGDKTSYDFVSPFSIYGSVKDVKRADKRDVIRVERKIERLFFSHWNWRRKLICPEIF